MEKHELEPSSSLFAVDGFHNLDVIYAIPSKREFKFQEEAEVGDVIFSESTSSCELENKSKKLIMSDGEVNSSPMSFVTSSPEGFITEKTQFVMNTASKNEDSWSKDDHYINEVSTKLTLFHESRITNNWELAQNYVPRCHWTTTLSRTKNAHAQTKVARKISAMKYYTREQEDEERKLGVSTKLKLYEDPFKIRKRLTKSDLGNMCRLLLGSNLIKTHVLPYLNTDIINQIESNKGALMAVWDQDTNSEQQLVLKKWATWKSYVLIEKWMPDFVQRRDLKQGDEIGFYWDPYNSRFNFRVFK